jgi:probable F420-dependent oxidoreductase
MKNSLRVGFGLFGLQDWWGGEFRPVLEVAQLADRMGLDQVSLAEHVVMGSDLSSYPYGEFALRLDLPWFEPIVVLSAIAAVTERIHLSAGVLIAPLRPGVLLAKQLATLDVMSRGRVEIGVGVGWQKAEYHASGIPWERRYARMDEQLRACRLLWSEAPARFAGETLAFEGIHAYPRPVQRQGIPVWMGLAATDRNCVRVAELADGWLPIYQDPEPIAQGVARIREAFAARGRDPESLEVRVVPKTIFGSDGRPNLEATLRTVPAFIRAGVTVVEMQPVIFCAGPDDLEKFFARVIAIKN